MGGTVPVPARRLTLGLLSIDAMDMEVIKRSGTDKEKWLVERIQPVGAC